MMLTLRSWLNDNPVLAAGVWFQLGLAAFALLAMPFDHREILGLNPWIKPLKFDLSIIIVLITFAAFLSGLQRFDSARAWAGGSIAVALSLENLLISFQAFRGVRSHMNYTTSFDAHVFMTMGLLAVIATVGAAWTLVLVFIGQPRWPAAVTWGVGLGLLMFLAGSVEGVVMVVHGGHTVGAVDGPEGLAFLNWSRRHGDLRVAHFFALHAMQAIPLLGYLCSRIPWSERLQVASVLVLAGLYAASVWLLFRQAMQGHSLV